ALLAQILQPPPQERDPAPGDAAVGLELRLPGTACPDSRAERAHASAEALEVLPHAAHPWEVVLQLRELDLKLALGAPRMLGEDVEDQLSPVDDPCLECVLERPLLGRLELVVHEEHLGPRLLVGALQLLQLSFADVGARLGPGPMLHELVDRLDERCPGEPSKLGQLGFGVDSLGQHGDDEPTLERGVRLALDHETDYAANWAESPPWLPCSFPPP